VGPYAVALLLLCIGRGVDALLPLNYYFMRQPLTGAALSRLRQFFAHLSLPSLYGVVGRLSGCTGTTFNFVHHTRNWSGRPFPYALGQARAMVSAIWGVFIWREFVECSRRVTPVYPADVIFSFCYGLGAIAVAPLYH